MACFVPPLALALFALLDGLLQMNDAGAHEAVRFFLLGGVGVLQSFLGVFDETVGLTFQAGVDRLARMRDRLGDMVFLRESVSLA